jgi:hypothetical protein
MITGNIYLRACSPAVEHLACTEESRVQFPAGPLFSKWIIIFNTTLIDEEIVKFPLVRLKAE